MRDPKLEPATIGILMVILSNKENWLVYPEEIAKRLNVSRDMIDRHLKKLEDAGYMRVVKKSLGRGRGVQTFRFFSDIKITDFQFEIMLQRLEDALQKLSTV
ncbi:TPA: helix-turn-helix domain-containing protein [Streptococcus pneumoniae]|uniref:helix-turn-helix domain-containing protein n=1 Tax=Streptococcus TaxID=1301 RepID=UPI00115617A9|nr:MULTISPECIES: helix-turn-helix domain-containing protein [Streptococcus]MBW8144757.1 helix-turn-helix domain-containing protein [Streptococcus pseudopneumoniae]HEU7697065.1 helix-turn-helix domain-containing protein [Streptococcus pneumoniae]HEV5799735.1 helix-turn-helix domain-containing protein [Streptococcus pneumoniae]HEV5956060.1 helix-turn-helix domain-containing protein [Streptococcus pneumoniae]HEV5983008.1 helix-turn-helix domain-containing protein [Streptococcus pneumoniae]